MKLISLLNELRDGGTRTPVILFESLHPRWWRDVNLFRKKGQKVRVIRFV
jgi:hypothetical protein